MRAKTLSQRLIIYDYVEYKTHKKRASLCYTLNSSLIFYVHVELFMNVLYYSNYLLPASIEGATDMLKEIKEHEQDIINFIKI